MIILLNFSYNVFVYIEDIEIESEYCVIIGGRSTPFDISSCAIDLVDGAQCI